MPRQNRVTPFGDIVAVPARGTLIAGGSLAGRGKHLLLRRKRMRSGLQDAGILERLPMDAVLLAQRTLANLRETRSKQR